MNENFAEWAIFEIQRLREAIKKHHDAQAHESCWENDAELYKVIGLDMIDRKLPPKCEFLSKCEEYYNGQIKNE